jgi:serine/threonine protein kinase/tetratricopeptide (TPR) repeat protein
MSAEDSTRPDEELLPWLLARDKALAAAPPSQAAPLAEVQPNVPPDWQAALACVQLLRQVLPRQDGYAAEVPPTPGSASPAESLPAQRLARFVIHRELGHGAFGIVFLASDPQLGRLVALKVPRPEALVTAELRERFVREARAAAGLDHPNLVPVYEAGTVGPLCYIASAYCPGITLSSWLKNRSEPVPLSKAASLVETLAQAVHHAHERGVVHRDLKPANILLQGTDRETGGQGDQETEAKGAGVLSTCLPATWSPKITDFGLAKLTADNGDTEDGARTESGAVLGTPNYMAPEQAGGKSKQVGPATDVYALGAILYELLTGRPPLCGETVLDTLEQVRTCEPLSPSRLRRGLPRDLETICLKCLHKEPTRRYASAAALADDLHRYLTGKPIQARPIRAWERGLKWARRRPAQAALLLVAVLGPLALLVVVLGYNAALATTNSQLQIANQELAHQRDQALDKARQAQAAVGELFVNYQQNWIKQPNFFAGPLIGFELDPQQQQWLAGQFELCQKFLREYGSDPRLNRETARAQSICGEIHYLLGRHAEAEQALQKALEWQQKLVDQLPGQPQAILDLIWTYDDLNRLYTVTKAWKRAETALQKIVALREQLLGEQPLVIDHYRALDEGYRGLAYVCKQLGKNDAAVAAFRQAALAWERLVQRYPDNTGFLLDRAQSYDMLQSDLLTLHPLESLEWNGRAIHDVEQVLRKEPQNFRARLNQFVYYNARAGILHRLGRYAESCEQSNQAIELHAIYDMHGGRLHLVRAMTLVCMGQYAKATAEVERCEPGATALSDGSVLFASARVLALSSVAVVRDTSLTDAKRRQIAEHYALRAIEMLKKAQATGFFRAEPNNQWPWTYKDLEPLRQRADFQRLFPRPAGQKEPRSTPSLK